MNRPTPTGPARSDSPDTTRDSPERSSPTGSFRDLGFWVAHDHPERPFDLGVFVCECAACGLAVRAAARVNPRFRLVVRGEVTRRVVTLAAAADAATTPEGLAALLEPGDRLRDLCAAAHNPQAPADPRATVRLRQALARSDSAPFPTELPASAPGGGPPRPASRWPADGLGR